MALDGAPRILLLGRGGQVGHELIAALSPLGEVVAVDRNAADLGDPESVRALVRRYRPRAVVNAAAYTAVDQAEREPELAARVNGMAPGILAEESEALGACLIHYSTDYVFDGSKPGPYNEDDPPRPLSSYGRSKLAGETAIAAAARRYLILRTCWVAGAHGANFLKTMLRLAGERDSLRVVNDQWGAPTTARLIAEVTARILEIMLGVPAGDPRWGVYHLAATGETSWHGYACYVIERARALGARLKATPDSILPIPTAAYPTPALRPANSRLDTTRLRNVFQVQLPGWQHGVDQVLEQLYPGRTA